MNTKRKLLIILNPLTFNDYELANTQQKYNVPASYKCVTTQKQINCLLDICQQVLCSKSGILLTISQWTHDIVSTSEDVLSCRHIMAFKISCVHWVVLAVNNIFLQKHSSIFRFFRRLYQRKVDFLPISQSPDIFSFYTRIFGTLLMNRFFLSERLLCTLVISTRCLSEI